MKQKIDSPLITEDRLKVIVKDTINDSIEDYDQKLTKRLLDSQEAFRKELDHKFEILDERWERRFTAFESRLLSVIDPLLQDIKIRQQEREIITGQISRVEGNIKNHEKRITQLEHSA